MLTMLLFLVIYCCGEYEKNDYFNYNVAMKMNRDSYIEDFFYDKQMSEYELIVNDYLLDNSIDHALLDEIISKLSIESLYYLTSKSRSYYVVNLAYSRLMSLSDEMDIDHNKIFRKK